MKKLIKNYTTTVDAFRTISEIEQILVENGATGIAKDYKDGKIVALYFRIIHNDKTLPFRLPAKIKEAFTALYGDKKYDLWDQEKNNRRKSEDYAQAERVAWRVAKTWIEAQITFVNLDQAKLAEVFFSYFMYGNQTMFEHMDQANFKLPQLPEAREKV